MNQKRIIIGFCPRSGKSFARIICRNFKHCVVLFPSGKKYILVQIGADGIRAFFIGLRVISRMRKDGWEFLETRNVSRITHRVNMLTCVGFAKRAAGIGDRFVLTPDQLYKKIKNPAKRDFLSLKQKA
jgi:hypothetical protein